MSGNYLFKVLIPGLISGYEPFPELSGFFFGFFFLFIKLNTGHGEQINFALSLLTFDGITMEEVFEFLNEIDGEKKSSY